MGDLFSGGQKGGYEKAFNQYQRGLNNIGQWYDKAYGGIEPWINSGKNALTNFEAALERMKNPEEFYRQLMEGYEESPYAKFQQEKGQEAINRAAAAAGNLGAGATQKDIADYTQKVSSQDMKNYLNDLLEIWGGYTSGLDKLQGEGYGGAQTAGNWALNIPNMERPYYDRMAESEYGRNVSKYSPWTKFIGGLGGGLVNAFSRGSI